MSYQQQILSRERMPSSIAELYQICDKPPPLNKLNPHRDDGKDGLKFYTDPTYFFELWKKETIAQQPQKSHAISRSQPVIQKPQPPSQKLQQPVANSQQSQIHQAAAHNQAPIQSKPPVYASAPVQPPPTQPAPIPAPVSAQPQAPAPPPGPISAPTPPTPPGPSVSPIAPPPPPALSPLPPPALSPPPPPKSPPPPVPPPAPPVLVQVATPQTITAAELQQKQRELKKAVPIQRDLRSDLLAAIKQGITLRRVESSKRKVEEEKQSTRDDVASILARRIPMQYSDSDESDAFDDRDNDWDDPSDR